MVTTPRSRPAVARSAVIAIPLSFTLLACGDASSRDSASRGAASRENADGNATQAITGPQCVSLDTTPVGLAVREFITTTTPTSQRYLSAAGTDSAVPEDGFKVLQEKGPTYFYSSDPKAQAQIKDKLASVGPYASLLVVFKGKTESENGNAVAVSLSGHFVGGDHDGKAVPMRTIQVRCDSTGWRVTSTATPPSGAAPTAPISPDSGVRP